MTEWKNDCVSVLTREGVFLSLFGSKESEPGQLYHPFGIVVDEDGVVHVYYVSDSIDIIYGDRNNSCFIVI